MLTTKNIVKKVNKLEEAISKLSDNELKNKTVEYRKNINDLNNEDFLVEAFAVVREATKRVTGKRLYDVQIQGGFILNQGKIAEIKAGEGKTLTEVLPVYINALSGNGVHVVTTNDYLAERDYKEIGEILNFLGISVGLIKQGIDIEERKKAYQKDVTYGTNMEFGFDYLRDNLANDIRRTVQRDLNCVIIDEVDSILLDEANTPLLIARNSGNIDLELYEKADRFVKKLEKITIHKEDYKNKKQQKEIEKYDYYTNEINKNSFLTSKGIKKAEKEFNINNLYDIENIEILSVLTQALRANGSLIKDIDYIVENGKVYIVDKFTGRMMREKRFTNGLHEAIEIKENVNVRKHSKTVATISAQNYFKMYNKIAGMSGTAKSSEDEFNEIYNLEVEKVKTNKPIIRKDYKDKIFINYDAKHQAIVDEIIQNEEKKQPILIGTASVKESEKIGEMLDKLNIKYNLLNAKHHEKEAEIIKQAGNVGKITISTNMAGRGTNIVVSEDAIKLGGLKVIGTQKYESERIDEQLRGRSGRQGIIGESVFFLSLEDNIINIYGNKKKIEKYKKAKINKYNLNKIIREFKKAQKKAESISFSQRKYLLKLDNIIDIYRKIIYADRKKVVESNIDEIFDQFLKYFCIKVFNREDTYAETICNKFIYSSKDDLEKEIKKRYNEEKKENENDSYLYIIKSKILRTIDENWIEFLNTIDSISDEVILRAYSGDDPIDHYLKESKKMFCRLNEKIKLDSITQILFGVNYDECIDNNWD